MAREGQGYPCYQRDMMMMMMMIIYEHNSAKADWKKRPQNGWKTTDLDFQFDVLIAE